MEAPGLPHFRLLDRDRRVPSGLRGESYQPHCATANIHRLGQRQPINRAQKAHRLASQTFSVIHAGPPDGEPSSWQPSLTIRLSGWAVL
jgi:hypothetical protein